MTHVGIQCLCPGDRQHHRAHGDERNHGAPQGKRECVVRRHCGQDLGVRRDLRDAQRRKDPKPRHHDRSKEPAHRGGPESLDGEEHGEHHQRQRQHQLLHMRVDHRQALERRHHRDRRGDHGVAIEQRSANHADHQRDSRQTRTITKLVPKQRHQRQDAALTVVVGSHHEEDVLEGHHQRHSPQHHRDNAEDVLTCGRHRIVVGAEHGLQRVEGAGTDVTEDHSQRSQREWGQRAMPDIRRLGRDHRCKSLRSWFGRADLALRSAFGAGRRLLGSSHEGYSDTVVDPW